MFAALNGGIICQHAKEAASTYRIFRAPINFPLNRVGKTAFGEIQFVAVRSLADRNSIRLTGKQNFRGYVIEIVPLSPYYCSPF